MEQCINELVAEVRRMNKRANFESIFTAIFAATVPLLKLMAYGGTILFLFLFLCLFCSITLAAALATTSLAAFSTSIAWRRERGDWGDFFLGGARRD